MVYLLNSVILCLLVFVLSCKKSVVIDPVIPKKVNLLAPEGGELFYAHDSLLFSAKVDSSCVQTLFIDLSFNNGKTWFGLNEGNPFFVSDYGSSFTAAIFIPETIFVNDNLKISTISESCLLKLRTYDPKDSLEIDITPSTFSIRNR